ncbi:MAG: LysR family transcriptional regulator [Chloroflexi bacterium]|nr:MAG: LysR family transcriptional regulator [Chloroflexota bacterium]MBL1195487.1 LysR family transcriptional regulator [Chloroflexota bacterium]NOH12769.1 LysR family transcriptional regulator [Chloroflexota bacterium]
MLDLTRLQTFVIAAETLSFSKTAKQLHLTQPTISHQIKALEQDLGVELFNRNGHSLQLTETGRFLLPWARKLIRQSNEMQDMLAGLDEQIIGQLRIACSTTAGKYILPQLAARFKLNHPGIQVSILACTPEHVIPRLLDGEANLGVVSYEAHVQGLEAQKFFIDYITLIVPADHPWAVRQSIEPTDLTTEPLIIREVSSGTHRVLLEGLARHDIAFDDLNVFIELGNAEAAVETVAAGYGITFVSRLATARALDQHKVVEVPVARLELQRTVYMARRNIGASHRPQAAFWGFIHDAKNEDLLHLAKSL